jgi:hypothetical protein
MQQNNMSSLQHGSLSSLSGVSMSQQLWWCETRDFKKRKGGRENDEDIVAKISQDLLQIQAKIFELVMLNHLF